MISAAGGGHCDELSQRPKRETKEQDHRAVAAEQHGRDKDGCHQPPSSHPLIELADQCRINRSLGTLPQEPSKQTKHRQDAEHNAQQPPRGRLHDGQ